MRRFRKHARKIVWTTVLLLVVFIGALVGNMLTTRSRQIEVEPIEVVDVDPESAQRFAGAVKIPTISHQNPAKFDREVFDEFRQFLEVNYPRLHESLSRITGLAFGDDRNQSLLFEWKGTGDSDALPILLMAHYDVVGIDASTVDQWKHPPFSGEIADGDIWGRGTLDDKGAVIALCEAAEDLLEQGFLPNRTVYFSFGHDEEVGGTHGNKSIAKWIKEQGQRFEFVLDEGGGIFNDVPGLGQPAALIGIGEKGFLTVKLTVNLDDTGHSSIPPQETAISILAEAIMRLQDEPFPARLDGGAGDMLAFVGPEMPFANRLAVSNRWLFEPLILEHLASRAVGNAAIRTTIAPTIIEGGFKDNVLPSEASVTLNLRLLRGDRINDAVDYLCEVVDDDRVTISEPLLGKEPSPLSSATSQSFQMLHRTIKEVYPEVVVAPFVVVAGTDASHYDAARLANNIYRFAPWRLGQEEIKRIHGINERIPQADFEDMIRFYRRLLENSAN